MPRVGKAAGARGGASAALQALLRGLPSVDAVLTVLEGDAALAELPHARRVNAVREALARERQRLLAAGGGGAAGSLAPRDAAALAREVRAGLTRAGAFSLTRVINATGVVLHTNLGRALLSSLALERLGVVAGGYSNLEMDIAKKERGSRYSHVDALLRRLTGAEGSLVVNNCASAVLLALETLARGKEVIVSRGELIEIGGEFRIPDIMRRSGAVLREVGATNRTHLKDYASAIGPDTGLLLKVHTSNYRVVGFTAAVSSRELVELGRERGIPVMEDLGSGSLLDLRPYGFPYEPTVPEVVASGRGPGVLLRGQAARRPAGRHRGGPRGRHRAPGQEPAQPRAPHRQVHHRRPGGDAVRLRGGGCAGDDSHAAPPHRAALAHPRAGPRALAPAPRRDAAHGWGPRSSRPPPRWAAARCRRWSCRPSPSPWAEPSTRRRPWTRPSAPLSRPCWAAWPTTASSSTCEQSCPPTSPTSPARSSPVACGLSADWGSAGAISRPPQIMDHRVSRDD